MRAVFGNSTAASTEKGYLPGHIKGEPIRFIRGHWAKTPAGKKQTTLNIAGHSFAGRKHSEASKRKMSRPRKTEVSYEALHYRLRKNHPKTGVCEECGVQTDGSRYHGTQYAFIGAGEYTDQREDYRELCQSCHKRLDRIIENIVGRK